MAWHQHQQGAAAGRRLDLALVLAAVALAGCRSRSKEFQISGTVALAPEIQAKAPASNAVLFIIAKNKGGVPVAVRRVVNPQFPLAFRLETEDMIVPLTKDDPLSLHVQLNTHGAVGHSIRGDLEGSLPGPVYSGARGVKIVINRQI